MRRGPNRDHPRRSRADDREEAGLLSAQHERIAAVGYDFDAEPKEAVERCNLCDGIAFAAIAHNDRYGFRARSLGCRDCGLVFMSPRLTAASYARFYAGVYRPLVSAFHGRQIDAESVEADQRPYARRISDLLRPFVGERTGGTILDVGGSTGVVSEEVAQLFSMNALVLDPAPQEVARAAARELEGVVGTIEDWDADGRRFEVILLCQTIDHLLDIASALTAIREVIADDGIFFVDIVDFRAAYLRNASVEAATKIDHPYSLTESTAETFLARAGFEVAFKDYAPDHLHIGYICRPTLAQAAVLPSPATVAETFAEIRATQNAPTR